MDAGLKKKWVAALRSGKYVQTSGVLKDGDQFCCLGVLCDVQGAQWLPQGDALLNNDLQSYYLSTVALERIDLTEGQQETLYHMNDDGKSFAEIADYIEASL